MRNLLPLLAFTSLLADSIVAPAQATASPAAAGSNWERVQALPTSTYLHVNTGARRSVCYLTTVDASGLSCSRDTGVAHTQLRFQRTEITTIKLARRGRSAVLGAAILGGAGAVAGGIQGAGSNYFAVKGAWAMVYGFGGLLAGAPIGYLTDFSSSTVYRAP